MSDQCTSETNHAIVLDCCTVVSAARGNSTTIAFKNRIRKARNVKICMPKIAIDEVSRVLKVTEEQAISIIQSFSHNQKTEWLEDDSGIVRTAQQLSDQYMDCHYPDNYYLAHSKELAAVLVTYDRKMRNVARLEGVMTCSPENFRIYH